MNALRIKINHCGLSEKSTVMKSIVSFLWKKRSSKAPVEASAVPVIATAVSSPTNLLARESSGRKVKKLVDTSTVFNQFEQLKRFQNANSYSPNIVKNKQPKSYTKIPLLFLVAILSAITASVVVLLCSVFFNQKTIVITPNKLEATKQFQYQIGSANFAPRIPGSFQLDVIVAPHRFKRMESLGALKHKVLQDGSKPRKDIKWRQKIAKVAGRVKKELSLTEDDLLQPTI